MLKLIVGLGNPGTTYARNRHNVGFMLVDRIHDRWSGGPWRTKFQSHVAEANVAGMRVMFVKPLTFMNESGRAVSEASRFYKVAVDDIVVVHDEIDLQPGKFRMKAGGGTGGHNGLKSISAHLRDGYRRLRIGVGHPGRKEQVPAYVLHDFAREDAKWLEPLLDAMAEEAPLLANGQDARFASKVHERLGSNGTIRAAAPPEAPPAAAIEAETRTAGGPFSVLTQLLRK